MITVTYAHDLLKPFTFKILTQIEQGFFCLLSLIVFNYILFALVKHKCPTFPTGKHRLKKNFFFSSVVHVRIVPLRKLQGF